MRAAIDKAKDLIENKESFVIAKVVDSRGSSPRKKGAWMLMRENGESYGTVGGGLLEAEAQKVALLLFQTKERQTRMFRLNQQDHEGLDMRCGGDVDVQFEYIDASNPGEFLAEFQANSRAIIFGAGHVGLALEPVLRHIGFETIIIDDRGEFANRERFPFANHVQAIESFGDAFQEMETDENSYIIIVTRGHAGDYDVLRQSMRRPCAYIGMIGSRKKVAETFQILREQDGFSQEQINKVYSPIGLSIHAETPEEIAVSIAAEMIQVRSGYGK